MLDVPRAADPHVSIVVVTAKRPERLLECLRAIAREAPPDASVEVVVVLNAAEASFETALADVAGLEIVRSDVPVGFAGGLNLGVTRARGALVHVLHDDAVVCAGWLEPLVAAFDDAEIGAAGSVIVDRAGRVISAGCTLLADGNTAPRTHIGDGEPTPVDYCSSASLVVRRDVWDAIGGADEGFHPAYFVDVDLATAVRSRGYRVVCVPRSRVRHDESRSSRSAKFRAFVYERNRRRFVAKWAGGVTEPSAATAVERERAVNDAYLTQLEAEVESLTEQLELVHRRNDELAKTLELIEQTVWWRLRDRVLALPGVVRALRRVSRRASSSRTG